MRILHTDRETFTEGLSHGAAKPHLFKRLIDREEFQTDWLFIDAAILVPGSGVGHHRHEGNEELFVTIDNTSQFTHNGRTTQVEGGAAVPLRLGESHAIYNHSDRETRFFNFNVVASGCSDGGATDFGDPRTDVQLESTDRLPVGKFDRDLLHYGRVCQGSGLVGRRAIWGPWDFQTNFGHVIHYLLPPHTSIGYHRHETIEECYVLMEGSGRMTSDDETREVSSGDVVLNPLGGTHGIYNPTQRNLELFALSVCMEKGAIDCVLLNEDLSDR